MGGRIVAGRGRRSRSAGARQPAVRARRDQRRRAAQARRRRETIEIFDERPDKPFDRDTEVRLTGEQLAARGAIDLATALALLPDVTVRDAGRGGFNLDIRGARKGAVSDPDRRRAASPIRTTARSTSRRSRSPTSCRSASSTTPQSPIDGPGGPGGVIEVHTRDAIGPQLVIARLDRRLAAELRRHRHRARRAREAPRAAALGVGASAARTTSTLPATRRIARGPPRRDRRDAARVPRRQPPRSCSTALSTIATTSRRRPTTTTSSRSC